jgi:hypothetical protein
MIGVCFVKRRGVFFNSPRRLPVVDFLAANRTFVELQGWDRVRPTLKLAGPVTAHLSDLGAARGAGGRLLACLSLLLMFGDDLPNCRD